MDTQGDNPARLRCRDAPARLRNWWWWRWSESNRRARCGPV